MDLADRLSRNKNENISKKSEKMKETRWKNHTIEKVGKQFWKFDNDEEIEIPEEAKRK